MGARPAWSFFFEKNCRFWKLLIFGAVYNLQTPIYRMTLNPFSPWKFTFFSIWNCFQLPLIISRSNFYRNCEVYDHVLDQLLQPGRQQYFTCKQQEAPVQNQDTPELLISKFTIFSSLIYTVGIDVLWKNKIFWASSFLTLCLCCASNKGAERKKHTRPIFF